MQGIWKKINWESIGWVMQELLTNRRHWVSKYVSGHFVMGKNMCRWKFSSSAKCPRCPDILEDKLHILTCPAPEARVLWEKSLVVIERWLKGEHTDMHLQEQPMKYLWSWPEINTRRSNMLPFLDDQNKIGIQHLWDGWLCCGW